MAIVGEIGHFGTFRKWPKSYIGTDSVHQTIKWDPKDGLDELEPNRSYLNHFPTLLVIEEHPNRHVSVLLSSRDQGG